VVVGGAAVAGHYAGKKSAQRSQDDADQQAQLDDIQDQQYDIQDQMAQQQQAPAQQAAPAGDPYAELKKLGDLHAAGVLTDEEFAAKKAPLLDQI